MNAAGTYLSIGRSVLPIRLALDIVLEATALNLVAVQNPLGVIDDGYTCKRGTLGDGAARTQPEALAARAIRR